MQCLTTVPVVESLLRAQCTQVKQGYKLLNVLACTCRTLRDAIGKGTPTWHWARRRSLTRHAWNQWRKLTKRPWLDQVPYWENQFRYATDEWFANDGPTYVAATGSTCRVEESLQPRFSLTSRLLWVAARPETGKEVQGSFTLAERKRRVAKPCEGVERKFAVRLHASEQEFSVGAHVYSGALCVDDSIRDATYVVDGFRCKIGRGTWRDVQHCYIPTISAFFSGITLEFTVQNNDVRDIVVECTAFYFDNSRRRNLVEAFMNGIGFSFPFDRKQIITARNGILEVRSVADFFVWQKWMTRSPSVSGNKQTRFFWSHALPCSTISTTSSICKNPPL